MSEQEYDEIVRKTQARIRATSFPAPPPSGDYEDAHGTGHEELS